MPDRSEEISGETAIKKLPLRPDRDLLDPNFDGYKLSLDPVATYYTKLDSPLGARSLSESQYSFAHAKLHHNFNSNIISLDTRGVHYIIQESGGILRVDDKSERHSRPDIVRVWSRAYEGDLRRDDLYGPSLKFADETLAVYGDGAGLLYFLDLGKTPWKEVFNEEICGASRSFVVLDALKVNNELHALLAYVDAAENVSSSLKIDKSVTVVEWMTFNKENDSWSLERVRRYVFFAPLERCSFNESGKSFHFVTDKNFKVVFDSTLGECFGEIENEAAPQIISPTNDGIAATPFYWCQTTEDIVVWICLPENTDKHDIKVDLQPSFISCKIKNEEPIMGGRLWSVLESDSMTWTIDGRKLEITASKVNEGMVWQRFLGEGSLDGRELTDPNAVDLILNVAVSQESSTYNVNELEDVDAAPDSNPYLYVINGDTNKVTSRADLGGHQWLFNGLQRFFCLRHDVDGLIWEMDIQGNNIKHISTFAALGYVQASKQGRKFTIASLDHSFAAIIDRNRHVYLYRQPAKIQSDLRNRKNGVKVKAIAKQSVITLEDVGEILGAAASSTSVLLCTEENVIVIRVIV